MFSFHYKILDKSELKTLPLWRISYFIERNKVPPFKFWKFTLTLALYIVHARLLSCPLDSHSFCTTNLKETSKSNLPFKVIVPDSVTWLLSVSEVERLVRMMLTYLIGRK